MFFIHRHCTYLLPTDKKTVTKRAQPGIQGKTFEWPFAYAPSDIGTHKQVTRFLRYPLADLHWPSVAFTHMLVIQPYHKLYASLSIFLLSTLMVLLVCIQ